MKKLLWCLGALILPGSTAHAQSYEMTLHLRAGGTVVFTHDQIRSIQFTLDPTAVGEPGGATGSRKLQLLPNYPNPFSSSTTIAYSLPEAGTVQVRIFDLKGAPVRQLASESQMAGRHELTWDGLDDRGGRVPRGVYFCAVQSGTATHSQQLILVR